MIWLGSRAASVVSWTNTQIVAQVAADSVTGTAQVLQYGAWSNSVPFSINTLRVESVNPASGAAGTSVTVTGGGFGAARGSGSLLLGSASGQVVSWSDTQIVAQVATGSVSGVARVQQGGAWSNAVKFEVHYFPCETESKCGR